MLRLHPVMPVYVRLNLDHFIERKKIHDSWLLSWLDCLELRAYYNGEEVTEDIAAKARQRVTRGIRPPLPFIEREHIVIEGTNGSFTSRLSNGTLRRLFLLFESYLDDIPNAKTIHFDYPIEVIAPLINIDSSIVIDSSNLALVLQLDPVSIYYYESSTVRLTPDQLDLLVPPTLDHKEAIWDSIDFAPLIASSPRCWLFPLIAWNSVEAAVACLDQYPSLLFGVLEELRCEEASVKLLDLLLTSDFDDYHLYRSASGNYQKLVNVIHVMETMSESIDRSQLILLLTKMDMRSPFIGNVDSTSWLPYRVPHALLISIVSCPFWFN